MNLKQWKFPANYSQKIKMVFLNQTFDSHLIKSCRSSLLAIIEAIICKFLKQSQKNIYCIKRFTLREKCPYSELFWSAFSLPYLVQMPENTDQNNSGHGHYLCDLGKTALIKTVLSRKNTFEGLSIKLTIDTDASVAEM